MIHPSYFTLPSPFEPAHPSTYYRYLLYMLLLHHLSYLIRRMGEQLGIFSNNYNCRHQICMAPCWLSGLVRLLEFYVTGTTEHHLKGLSYEIDFKNVDEN